MIGLNKIDKNFDSFQPSSQKEGVKKTESKSLNSRNYSVESGFASIRSDYNTQYLVKLTPLRQPIRPTTILFDTQHLIEVRVIYNFIIY